MRTSILIALIMLSLWVIPSGVLSFSQTSNSQIISGFTIPSTINYTAKIVNSTTINNKTIEKIYNYTLSYHIISITQDIAYVNVSGNFTNNSLKLGNVVYVTKGLHVVNLIFQPISIYYPYIISDIIYNTSYGIITPNESIALDYSGKGYVLFDGANTTVYNYSGVINGNSIKISLLPNGIIYHLENNSLYITLTSYSTFLNVTLNTSSGNNNIYQLTNYIQKPYLYAIYNYSTLSNSTLPVGYLEIDYPLLFENGILVTQITQIQIRAGQNLALPSLLEGKSVNFVIYINNPMDEPTSFIVNIGNQSITWNGFTFVLVNKTTISTIAGSFEAYEYRHYISSNLSAQLLYFSTNGVLLKEESVSILNSSVFPVFISSLVGNNYINPSETYPNVFNYTNTTLPFKVINPNLSLTISIIVTIIIIAVIVLLHKRE